ncbi:hypothetical protein [Variovorax boronicumulans]|uniref:hypothetical protein n=1 Tax=Variovorax boronicumulans TaxID=436515 RepID=UPI003B974D32
MEGGRTVASNIVAACRYCNHGRHALFPDGAPDPETYSVFVLLSVAAGLWHGKGPCFGVRTGGVASAEGQSVSFRGSAACQHQPTQTTFEGSSTCRNS